MRNTESCRFQFTPLREGLLKTEDLREYKEVFQFTPLREGLQIHFKPEYNIYKFQFTPLREGLRQLRNI